MDKHLENAEEFASLLPERPPTSRTPAQAEYQMISMFGDILTGVLGKLSAEYGPDVLKVAEDAFIGSMVTPGAEEFETFDRRDDVRTYVQWLLGGLTIGQKYEVVESSEDSVRLRFTSCPLAGYFRSIGKPEIGRFFCHVDRPMIKAFNPGMEFEITKTLMNGDDHCNHHFFVQGLKPARDASPEAGAS